MFLFCSHIRQCPGTDHDAVESGVENGRQKMDMTALFRDLSALTAMAFAGYIVMVIS